MGRRALFCEYLKKYLQLFQICCILKADNYDMEKEGLLMKRSATLLFAILMTASLLASCGGGETETAADTAAAVETTAETETELTHGLGTYDFGGVDYVAMVRQEKMTHFDAEEYTGEPLNDSVYDRNTKVTEEFNVTLGFVPVVSDMKTFNEAISQSIMSQDQAYDIITPDYWWGSEVNGWFFNLTDIDVLALDQPWWCGGWNEAATVEGMLPGAVGWYTLDMISNMNVVFFNKDLYAAAGLDDTFGLDGLYNTVREGKWTMDLFRQMSTTAAQDLNGDGEMTDADLYGSVSELQAGRAILWSSGMELCRKEEDGTLVPTLTSEKNYDIFKMALSFYEDDSNLYTTDGGLISRLFMGDQIMFNMKAVGDAVGYRDMEADFGIVPFPKYDDETGYRSRNFGSSYFAIPITAKDTEMSAVVLEAQNFYSYRDVRPTYYDTILKSKAARDEDTCEMLDLVMETCYIDPFFIYGTVLSGVADAPFNLVTSGKDTYMSKMESLATSIDTKLQTLIEALQQTAQ